MAVATTAPTAVALHPRLFTVDDLEAMVKAGIIREDERVELIEGQIVEMSATGTRHTWTVIRLARSFSRRDDVVVSSQSTFQIGEYGGPEPDVVMLRADAPQDRLPSSDHAVLIVEVADTSLAHDRYTKAPLYARAGIPEYWIVDLNGERVEVYREPSPAGYRSVRFVLRGERLSPSFAPDMVIEVDTILGPVPASDDEESPPSPPLPR
jgi:Uma2 family endonuclease